MIHQEFVPLSVYKPHGYDCGFSNLLACVHYNHNSYGIECGSALKDGSWELGVTEAIMERYLSLISVTMFGLNLLESSVYVAVKPLACWHDNGESRWSLSLQPIP